MSGIASRQRKSFTLEEKFKINKDKNPNTSNESLAAEFNCGKSIINSQKLWGNKERKLWNTSQTEKPIRSAQK